MASIVSLSFIKWLINIRYVTERFIAKSISAKHEINNKLEVESQFGSRIILHQKVFFF